MAATWEKLEIDRPQHIDGGPETKDSLILIAV
jgi:hypothetical protein